MNKFYVARDKSDFLYLYTDKPVATSTMYMVEEIMASTLCLDKNLFPDLRFEDGPVEVKLIEVKS